MEESSDAQRTCVVRFKIIILNAFLFNNNDYDMSQKIVVDKLRTLLTNWYTLQAWLAEINEYAQDDVVIMLIGNKADLTAERAVQREEGIQVAKV